MGEFSLVARSRLPVGVETAREWLERPAAERRTTPAWKAARGCRAERATEVESSAGETVVVDRARVSCPTFLAPWARSGFRRLSTYRHRVIPADLARHEEFAAWGRRTVAVSGASGLVGRAVTDFLEAGGHTVKRLVRRAGTGDDEIGWDPSSGEIEATKLEGIDAVVHLAGEGIASGRWTAARKERIRASRVDGTTLVARTLAALDRPPSALVAASAIGFYGDRGDEAIDESSPAGEGFLADTCREWESSTGPAERAGVRVVHLRIGVVLAAAGGALAAMLPPFRLGLGGRIGDGRQQMSWIALDDLVGIVHRALSDDGLRGPVNAVGPTPLSNSEFTRSLARVLDRPAVLPLPAAAIVLRFGEMGRELLLAGAHVRPARLLESGFRFGYEECEAALRFELGRFDGETAGLEIRFG